MRLSLKEYYENKYKIDIIVHPNYLYTKKTFSIKDAIERYGHLLTKEELQRLNHYQ